MLFLVKFNLSKLFPSQHLDDSFFNFPRYFRLNTIIIFFDNLEILCYRCFQTFCNQLELLTFKDLEKSNKTFRNKTKREYIG